jgi:hypothetical protein
MNASIALPNGIIRPAARSPERWERSLARRQTFGFDAAEKITVSCLDGMLWATIEGDAMDYVLAPGQALRVPAGSRLVLQALREARFGVARG